MVREGWSWEGCSHNLVPEGWVSPVAYLWRDREEGGEFLVLCDHVPVFNLVRKAWRWGRYGE